MKVLHDAGKMCTICAVNIDDNLVMPLRVIKDVNAAVLIAKEMSSY